jgi:hypothetical protein
MYSRQQEPGEDKKEYQNKEKKRTQMTAETAVQRKKDGRSKKKTTATKFKKNPAAPKRFRR